MSVKNFCVVALCAASITVSASQAANLSDGVLPSEFPPRDYSGNQFVDSSGCVFVRAGNGAGVRWVPRVQRNRAVLCGYSPTFAKTIEAPAVVAPSTRAATVVPTPTLVQPSVTTTAKPTISQSALQSAFGTQFRTAPTVTPVPTRSVTTTTRRVGTPIRTIASPIVTPSAPVVTTRPVLVAPTAAPVLRAPVVRTQPTIPGAGACGGTSYATAFKSARGDVAVRCGPQAVHPSTFGRQGSYDADGFAFPSITNTPSTISGKTAKVKAPTRASYRAPLYAKIDPPKGYGNLWKDDRLNTMRAVGTAVGDAQMRMVWTDELPRRLVPYATQ